METVPIVYTQPEQHTDAGRTNIHIRPHNTEQWLTTPSKAFPPSRGSSSGEASNGNTCMTLAFLPPKRDNNTQTLAVEKKTQEKDR